MIHPILYAGLPEKKQTNLRYGNTEAAIDDIMNITCIALGIEMDVLISRTRKGEVAEARLIAAGLILRLRPEATLKTIGRAFARDHATIIHYRETFSDLYGRDKAFTKKADAVKALI